MTSHRNDIVLILKKYFEDRNDVAMAFLFGSWARGTMGLESDVDIAVFFLPSPESGEQGSLFPRFPQEDDLWSDLERVLGRNVDLLVLNRAAPTVAESAVKGIPVALKDRSLYLSFLIRITSEAEDFREWVEDFRRLKEMRRHGAHA